MKKQGLKCGKTILQNNFTIELIPTFVVLKANKENIEEPNAIFNSKLHLKFAT